MTESNGPSCAPRDGCRISIERCELILQHIDDGEFTHRPNGHSSIGEHMRHVVEMYRCFLISWKKGPVQYDNRPRDPELETSQDIMSASLADIRQSLEAFDAEAMKQPVILEMQCSEDVAPNQVPSRVDRELAHLSGHTMHHIAHIALLADMQGIQLPKGLGLAFSTQAHLAQTHSN